MHYSRCNYLCTKVYCLLPPPPRSCLSLVSRLVFHYLPHLTHGGRFRVQRVWSRALSNGYAKRLGKQLGDVAGATQTRIYVRRIALRRWPAFWCFMVYRNILACGRDIRDGVRSRPGSSLVRQNSRDRHRAGQAQGERSCAPTICCSRRPAVLESPFPVAATFLPGNAPPEPSRLADVAGTSTMSKPHVARWALPPRLQSIGNGATTWDMVLERSTGFDRPQDVVRREGKASGGKLSVGEGGGEHVDSGV